MAKHTQENQLTNGTNILPGVPDAPDPSPAGSLTAQASEEEEAIDDHEQQLNDKMNAIKKSYTAPGICVHLAGLALAGCAGCVNAVCFLELGFFVSHITGTATKLSLQIDDNLAGDWYTSLLLIVFFIVGSTFCGMLIGKTEVSIGMAKYGMVLMGNCALLCLTVIFNDHYIAPLLAAAACGLQNGMATSYSTAVIRTTHMTGISTDMGLLMGRIGLKFLRSLYRRRALDIFDFAQIAVDGKKLGLLSMLLFGYVGGALLGSRLSRHVGIETLLLPAGITGVSGLLYTSWRVFILHQSLLNTKDMGSPQRPVAQWPPNGSDAKECGCGNVFMIDSLFCRKCGLSRDQTPKKTKPQQPPQQQKCDCGALTTSMPDAHFCRSCGKKLTALGSHVVQVQPMCSAVPLNDVTEDFERLGDAVKNSAESEVNITQELRKFGAETRTDRHLVFGVLRDGERRLKRIRMFHSLYTPSEALTEDDAVAGSRRIISVVDLGDELNGHEGIVHGGFAAALLDDLLAWGSRAEAHAQLGPDFGATMTANLNVNYRAPMFSNGVFEVDVWAEKVVRSKKIYVRATVKDAKGQICIDASSLFIIIKGSGKLSNCLTESGGGGSVVHVQPVRSAVPLNGMTKDFERLVDAVKNSAEAEFDLAKELINFGMEKRTDRHLIWGVLRDGDRRIKRIRIFHSLYTPLEALTEDDAVAGSRRIVSVVELGDELNGHEGIVHGGFTSALLDDLLGWGSHAEAQAQLGSDYGAPMTANLNVNYRAPMFSNGVFEVDVWTEKLVRSKKMYLKATVKDATGQICIDASCLYIILKGSGKLCNRLTEKV